VLKAAGLSTLEKPCSCGVDMLTGFRRHARIGNLYASIQELFSVSELAIQLLLVEDNFDFAGVLQLLFHSENRGLFEIQHASSLAKATDLVASHRFDIILLDLTLPDSDGLDTIIHMHAHAPRTPIVVMTALSDGEIINRAIQEGAQDYLIKGVPDGATLVRSIRYAIERNRTLSDLQHLSMVDELTGLLNRRGFLHASERQMEIARRAHRSLLLFFADLDDLKLVNDRHGHLEGDQALKHTAKLLSTTFRHSDVIARYGGDEFAILAIDADGDAMSMAERLKETIEVFNHQNHAPYSLSISIGTARFEPYNGLTLDDLVSRADRELYEQIFRKKSS
jgi:two-component system cell cycle response regulator